MAGRKGGKQKATRRSYVATMKATIEGLREELRIADAKRFNAESRVDHYRGRIFDAEAEIIGLKGRVGALEYALGLAHMNAIALKNTLMFERKNRGGDSLALAS